WNEENDTMEFKDHREEGRSEPQGRGKSRREERDDGPVEERAAPHAERPRGRRICLFLWS
ncbi:MAG: hypothetical protein CME89_14585, partial [Hirschia sp.]|nr:hypothetical protein [Hirschia sp.]